MPLEHTVSAQSSPEQPTRMNHTAKKRKKAPLIAALVTTTLVAGGGVFFYTQQPSVESPTPPPLVVEKGEVTKGDLIEQIRVQGKLGYAGQQTIGTELTGTVTHLPTVGAVIKPGKELFRINDQPVVLLAGDLPAWRSFGVSMSNGRDVTQLEQNLVDLGFFPHTPDQKFTAATAKAVKAYQKSVGLKQTGALELGQAIFLPTEVRVQELKVAVGGAAAAETMIISNVASSLVGLIETGQVDLAPVDSQVTVLLPAGVEATGKVLSHGAAIEVDGDSGPTRKIPVTVELDGEQENANADDVKVSILLSKTRASDVILVPTAALLAQPGGGFAVEVPAAGTAETGPTTTLVPVTLGAFANGLVEVTSGDLKPGDTVVVAK